jgi:outer membrane protein assembly factor BamB
MLQQQRPGLRVVLALATIVLAEFSGGQALGQADVVVRPVWQLQLPSELQGLIYEVAIPPGEPRLVATTTTAILSVNESGELEPLIRLAASGSVGESATLADNGSRAGILIHQNHAIAGFRLVDLRGETLAAVDDPRQFHYRVAPDGATFVGIDAGGQHVPAKAERFVYRFYDGSGRQMAEVESADPQPMDSAYTADGAAFVLNNGQGLAAYRITDGGLLWRVAPTVRFFAPASSQSQLVAASGATERKTVAAFRNGEPVWRFDLEGNVRSLAVSPSGAFILATDGGVAHLFSNRSGTPLWSFEVPDQALVINSVAVSDRGVVAIGAQHNDLTRGLALILDSDRRILFERVDTHGQVRFHRRTIADQDARRTDPSRDALNSSEVWRCSHRKFEGTH